MKNFIALMSVGEVLTSEQENSLTGEHEEYVRSRWIPLCERKNEIHGSGANAFRRLWKRDYSEEQWQAIVNGKAISQGDIVTKAIVPQDFESDDGVTRKRRKIVLAVFNGETPHDALAKSTFGDDAPVFLEDAQEDELQDTVKLDEAPEDVAETIKDEA